MEEVMGDGRWEMLRQWEGEGRGILDF